MNLIIKRISGEEYIFSRENGFIVRDFIPSPPVYRTDIDDNENRNGEIDNGTVIKSRPLDAFVFFTALDYYDFTLKRNEVLKWLDSREYFYIIDDREPGKRWKVKVENHTLGQLKSTAGEFQITFKCYEGLAESIGTTTDPFTFDNELWQIGQGLIAENTVYTHETTRFRIWNAGDVPVDPCEMPLLITIHGASNNLKIQNLTTGDSWQYYSSTSSSDTIKINDVQALKNGISIFSNTNMEEITIAPGWNDFEISGITGAFEISFGFRFYYLM
ncbi:phage tail family protein [Bacillus sp. FSL R10-2780]|uniref:phage tail family protein n=1 Tax=Bacillus sp. FSL R10-2780 TaxID=2954660 RepID=UPI0030F9F1A8